MTLINQHNSLEFSNYIYNKKVLLVGNSTELLKRDYGKWIDNFDVVVRFNRIYNQLPNYSQLGRKTDILFAARPVERLLTHIPSFEDIDWLCWSTEEREMRERCPEIRAKYWPRLIFVNQFVRKIFKEAVGVFPTSGYVAFDWFVCMPAVAEVHTIGFDWFENASIVTMENRAHLWHKPSVEKETMMMLAKDHPDRIRIWQTKISTDSETPTLLEV